MKKSFLYEIKILSALLVTFLVITGCSSSSGGAVDSNVFSDNFDSYALENPWTPLGGWTGTGTWAIVAGLSGNGVQKVDTGSANLTSSYTGTDYTVSVRVRPTAIANSWYFGICARDDGSNNRYCAFLNDNTSTPTTAISIFKFWNNGSTGGDRISETYIASDLDTSTYYTLTLKVSGLLITATVTDGINSHTVTWTDDGGSGSIIPSGTAGLMIYSGLAYPVIYDNFIVTEP